MTEVQPLHKQRFKKIRQHCNRISDLLNGHTFEVEELQKIENYFLSMANVAHEIRMKIVKARNAAKYE